MSNIKAISSSVMRNLFIVWVCLSWLSLCFELQAQTKWESNETLPMGGETSKLIALRGVFPPEGRLSALQLALNELQPGTLNTQSAKLVLLDSIVSPIGTHLHYRQTWLGVPILDAFLKVNLSADHRVLTAFSSLRSVQDAPTQGTWTDSQADEAQRAATAITGGNMMSSTPVWFVTSATQWEEAHAIRLTETRDHALREVVVGVRSGLVLNRLLSSNKCRHHLEDGLVFRPDPLSTAQVAYGGYYVDNNDADNAQLRAQRVQVPLRNLKLSNGTYLLEGPYVVLKDMEAPTVAVPTSTTGDFFFNRSESGFECVNVYYHIDSIQRYIQTLGITNLGDRPIQADAHAFNGEDNSRHQPNGNNDNRLYFGEGGIDDAEDADVIVHEYTHNLSYTAAPNTNTGTERRGFDEGISDYIAYTWSRQFSSFNRDKVFNWDGNNGSWQGRNVKSNRSYPSLKANGTTNIYQYGDVISQILVQFYEAVGQNVADQVALNMLYFSAANMTLDDVACNMLTTEGQLFNNQYRSQLAAAIQARGVQVSALCGVVSSVYPSREATVTSLQLFPNPVRERFYAELPQASQPWEIVILSVSGQVVARFSGLEGRAEVLLPTLPAGVYGVQATNPAAPVLTTKVIIY